MLTNELRELYDGYYNENVAKKRVISAKDSIRELVRVANGRTFDHLLDVGAGEGSVLQEIEASGFTKKISVVEISQSGIDAIEKRNLASVVDIQQFDGYHIPHPDKSFDLSLATYVLEHVEHERSFLREMARVAERVIVAIPMEHTLKVKRNRAIGESIGHINFYTMDTFRNVLETSGLEVEQVHSYTTSRDYEKFVSPKSGGMKYLIRSMLLKTAPRIACSMFTYMAIAMCKAK